MIKEYACSVIGKSHLRSLPLRACQDAYRVLTLPNGYKVAAAADGVGSCKHADRGAQIAVKTVTDFIRDNYPLDGQSIPIKSMIRTAYSRALIEIQKEAERNHNPLSDYDTTLMVAIFGGETLYWGHVGDGGIVVLKSDGSYVELSERQNVDGMVFPLRAGYKFWQINELNEPIASVFLATDGMMDKLRNTGLDQGFYVPLLMMLADPNVIHYLKKKWVDISEIVTHGHTKYNKTLLNAFYYALHKRYHFDKAVAAKLTYDIMVNQTPFDLLAEIQDDKTFVCVYDTTAPLAAQKILYYAEPNWKLVYENLQKKLYPGLYEEAPQTAKLDEADFVPSQPFEQPIKREKGLLSRTILRIWKHG